MRVSVRRTATDRKCTDARGKQSLCNGGSWAHSNRSRSNIVISHNPTCTTFPQLKDISVFTMITLLPSLQESRRRHYLFAREGIGSSDCVDCYVTDCMSHCPAS